MSTKSPHNGTTKRTKAIEITGEYAVSVSNRQFVLLSQIYRNGGITLQKLLALSQTTSGSVVRRGLVAWNKQLDVFVLTGNGLKLIEIYKQTDITRIRTDGPLSKFIKGVD